MGPTPVRMTVAEFVALPDDDGMKRELVDGEVSGIASGGPVHELGKGRIYVELAFWAHRQNIRALVQSETRYYLNEIDIYQPDVSVVLGDTLDPKSEGRITVAPDLAVEVVSSEPAQRLRHKTKALLKFGTRVVVVIYPVEHEVLVYRPASPRRF